MRSDAQLGTLPLDQVERNIERVVTQLEGLRDGLAGVTSQLENIQERLAEIARAIGYASK